jgi:hypothetical protein
MKQYKTTTVDGYLLILDENKDIEENMYTLKDGEIIEVSYLGQDNGNAIIAHLPLNNSPILEGVPLLPSTQEDDVYDSLVVPSINKGDGMEQAMFNDGYYAGYKKTKEKYKYTEHEIRMAYMQGYNRGVLDIPNEMENYIQSIEQPKLPVAFNCEMENYCGSPFTTERCPKCVDSCDKAYLRSKTTSTPNGEQWVGEWVY